MMRERPFNASDPGRSGPCRCGWWQYGLPVHAPQPRRWLPAREPGEFTIKLLTGVPPAATFADTD
jgi:hypothetical protein